MKKIYENLNDLIESAEKEGLFISKIENNPNRVLVGSILDGDFYSRTNVGWECE